MFFFHSAVASDADGLVQDVVNILEYLCEKLKLCVSSPHARHTEALLLEGVYAILHNVPVAIRESVKFTDIVWSVLPCCAKEKIGVAAASCCYNQNSQVFELLCARLCEKFR